MSYSVMKQLHDLPEDPATWIMVPSTRWPSHQPAIKQVYAAHSTTTGATTGKDAGASTSTMLLRRQRRAQTRLARVTGRYDDSGDSGDAGRYEDIEGSYCSCYDTWRDG